MTRKDFELIAEAISNVHQDNETEGTPFVRFTFVVDALASALASTNPRFDKHKFIAACCTQDYRAPKGISQYD